MKLPLPDILPLVVSASPLFMSIRNLPFAETGVLPSSFPSWTMPSSTVNTISNGSPVAAHVELPRQGHAARFRASDRTDPLSVERTARISVLRVDVTCGTTAKQHRTAGRAHGDKSDQSLQAATSFTGRAMPVQAKPVGVRCVPAAASVFGALADTRAKGLSVAPSKEISTFEAEGLSPRIVPPRLR